MYIHIQQLKQKVHVQSLTEETDACSFTFS